MSGSRETQTSGNARCAGTLDAEPDDKGMAGTATLTVEAFLVNSPVRTVGPKRTERPLMSKVMAVV